MTIGRKLFLTFAVTFLGVATVGGLGLLSLTLVKSQEERIYKENFQAYAALMDASEDYLKMRQGVRDLVLSETAAKGLEAKNQLDALDLSFRDHMRDFRTASGMDYTVKFEQTYNDYRQLLTDLSNQVQAGKHSDAESALYNVGAARALAMTTQMEEAQKTIRQAIDTTYQDSVKVVTTVYEATAFLLALSAVFNIAAGLFLTRSLAAPLIRASALTKRLSEGDLTVRAAPESVRRTDEVGTLARAINELADRLAGFAGTLKETGAQIDKAAEDLDLRATEATQSAVQIAGKAREGHQLASDQASGVSETTAAVAQITATVEKFDQLIETQAAAVTQSSASLEEMASNIRSLSDQAGNLGKVFGGLKEASDDGRVKLQAMVAKITAIHDQSARLAEANSMIKSIASKTNLLSMNAAIEAAHAGEAGAGFAVVASEIRTLAEQVSSRSKEISQEVKLIQALILEASRDSETSQAAFDTVLDRVEDMGRFEAELAGALSEQDEGAKQILEATIQVSSVTQEVRQGSTEILGGTVAISHEMESLQDLSRRLEATLEGLSDEGSHVSEEAAGVQEGARTNRTLSRNLDAVVGEFRVS